MLRIVSTITVGFALAACSSSPAAAPVTVTASPPAAATSASPTPTATPSPTPTVMSKAVAADYYLGTVCPANAVVDKLNALVVGKQQDQIDLAKARAAAKKAAAALRGEAQRFDAPPLPWPANVRAQAATLTTQSLAEVGYYQSLAAARTFDDFLAAWNDFPDRKHNVAAQTARLRLGLPAASQTRDGCARWLAANPT